MEQKTRPWTFYDSATSLCSQCLRRVDAKIVLQDDRVWMLKRCAVHGRERVLLADDAAYWRRAREDFLKPSELPRQFNTEVRYGCPYDCGLCPEHEQHTCLAIVEVTDACNLTCPVCYANSGPHRPGFRSLDRIEAMLDAVVANEGEPDVVQISGGEPTLHPEFFRILDAAKARPIQHLILNTNGIRIAEEPGFAKRISDYMPGFEVYLQWDSLEPGPLRKLRGQDLTDVRGRALDALDEVGVSTTLVVTVERGTNDHEMGDIIDHALTRRCIRGVTFQPVQAAGRQSGHDPERHRLTLTEVRRRILEQTGVFADEDLVPVPCHPDSIATAYAIKHAGKVTPLTGLIDPEVLLTGSRDTIAFERDPARRHRLLNACSTGHSTSSGARSLARLLCCLPQALVPKSLGYENLFRVIIMDFLDAQSFELRAAKKTCVHIVHPEDLRLIPFDAYNLLYRDGLEANVLEPLRETYRV
ncbi:MAG: radical SAM protein [Planctomycetes bacterium]|nr:radical SAM protein [Planctomycetota bacterium]